MIKKKSNAGRKWFDGKDEKMVISKLEEAFAIGCTNREACLYSDITEIMFYNYVKNKPELTKRFSILRDKPILKARNTIVKNLHEPRTASWYLERKNKDEFSTKIETDNTHKITDLEKIESTLKNIGSQLPAGKNKPSEGDSKDAV